MATRRITAYFDTFDDAARAVKRLEADHLQEAEISLISSHSDDLRSRFSIGSHDGSAHPGEGAGAGATLGTLAGGGAGLLAGLGLLAVPGFGPVVAAGWLASMLVGAGAGAAAGGLAGALVGAGFEEDEAQTYAEGIRSGGVLLIVRAGPHDSDRVARILGETGNVDRGDQEPSSRDDVHAPPIGAAASTTTGLTTDLMPNPLDEDDRLHVEAEDERLRYIMGKDRDPA